MFISKIKSDNLETLKKYSQVIKTTKSPFNNELVLTPKPTSRNYTVTRMYRIYIYVSLCLSL